MDPDALLEQLREFARMGKTDSDHPEANEQAQRACEVFEELDEWLTSGGFPPCEWRS